MWKNKQFLLIFNTKNKIQLNKIKCYWKILHSKYNISETYIKYKIRHDTHIFSFFTVLTHVHGILWYNAIWLLWWLPAYQDRISWHYKSFYCTGSFRNCKNDVSYKFRGKNNQQQPCINMYILSHEKWRATLESSIEVNMFWTGMYLKIYVCKRGHLTFCVILRISY